MMREDAAHFNFGLNDYFIWIDISLTRGSSSTRVETSSSRNRRQEKLQMSGAQQKRKPD